MRKWAIIGMAAGLMAMAGGVWTGCESASGTGGLSISPDSYTIGGSSSNGTSVILTAQVGNALALPLSWSVSNPTLGTIERASGSNAVYRANAGRKGDNIVTARDQYDNEGFAVITQQ